MLKNQFAFVFDKARIRHELQTNLYRFRFCPFIDFNFIDAILAVFPNEVVPSENGPWGFTRDYSESPGSILIKSKHREGGMTFVDEYHSSGVKPNNISVAMDILRTAAQRCGRTVKELQGVLDYKTSGD